MESYQHHDLAFDFYLMQRSIKKGREPGTISDVIRLLRKSLEHEKQAFVKCREKHQKKYYEWQYKNIQRQLRLLTWSGKVR